MRFEDLNNEFFLIYYGDDLYEDAARVRKSLVSTYFITDTLDSEKIADNKVEIEIFLHENKWCKTIKSKFPLEEGRKIILFLDSILVNKTPPIKNNKEEEIVI